MKAAIQIGSESQSNLLEDLGNQLLATGAILNPAELASAVDAITAQDVATVNCLLLSFEFFSFNSN